MRQDGRARRQAALEFGGSYGPRTVESHDDPGVDLRAEHGGDPCDVLVAEDSAYRYRAHARLRAYFNAFFSRPNLDPQVLTAWIVYWSLVQVSPEMRAVHVEEGRGYGELLGRLLSDLARARRVQTDLKQAVVGLTCLLDGLWLKWCLDPESYRPKDAAALCEDWVDRMIDPQPKGFSTR